jgi:hypothetical protein
MTGRATLDLVRDSEVNAALRELQIIRVIITHCLDTIAAADRVPRLESDRVLGCEGAERRCWERPRS